MDELELAGSQGRVHIRHWGAEGPARARVLVVHGYAEHGGRYAHVAEALRAEGLEVVAPDHPGHGHSEGERAVIGDFDAVADDLVRIADLVDERAEALPLVVVGHSMGGLLSARLAQRHPARAVGVAFLGGVLGDWTWAREALAAPELTTEVSDPAGMSRDPEAARAYETDPLVYHGPYKRPLLEAEVVALDAFQRDREALRVPVAFFHGDADPFVSWRESLDGVLSTGTRDLRIRIYEGARHELVNETNRDEVIAELRRWILGLPAVAGAGERV